MVCFAQKISIIVAITRDVRPVLKSIWTCSLGALALLCVIQPAHTAQCPDDIEAGDCVANDLQPTGTQIINGPDACTIGETISLDLRVLFENGGGANERYSVGFFVGDNGDPPIGGASCTFDSLQPVGAPIDLTGGSGGFLELNGDACGDISKSDPTYKDIALNNVACVDNNGDGNVDIGYVLSWANNGNQENCTNPLDPAQFQPDPPKCQAELEYDLPIEVELPPSIQVGKGVQPSTLREPGGDVTITFTIVNTSPSINDPVTITSITDVPLGDLTNSTSCTLPFTLAPGATRQCTYTTTVTGVAGDIFPDTVTVTGEDDEGNVATDDDSAQVEIIDATEPPQPGDLKIQKYAIPTQLYEPGGKFTYLILLDNVSETSILVDYLNDDIYGNLDGEGTCQLPISLEGANSIYLCEFARDFFGSPGDSQTNVVTARGSDATPLRTVLEASDDATVFIRDRRSDLEVTKIANPETIAEPGQDVTYTLYIQNASSVDSLRVDRVADSLAGTLGVQCGVPFTLAPGEIKTCSFVDTVIGNAGDFVTNTAIATGIDDDGLPVFDDDSATVRIVGAPSSLEVTKLALPPLAAEVGSDVTYLVVIENTSSLTDPVTITSLIDEIQDNAGTVRDVSSTCAPPLPQTIPAGGSLTCSYTQTVDGSMTTPVNDPLINVVTASGVDDDGQAVTGSDDAEVRFVAVAPARPELDLSKTASPVSMPEPGGDVTFTVLVANTGDPGAPDITITSLDDDIYGDLSAPADCGNIIGQVLAAGESASCDFVRPVTGSPSDPGNPFVDIVTVEATFVGGSAPLVASDTASVEIIDLPGTLSIVKTASPTTLIEPGGEVTFDFVLTNTSAVDAITLTSVTDSIYGDLNSYPNCDFNRTLAPGESYSCDFTILVSGSGGAEEVNTVTAIGQDDDGIEVQATDQATVDITDNLPDILARKWATPRILPDGGGPVVFNFQVRNTSSADTLTIDTLMDSIYGDLNNQGDCTLPQQLAPGETYRCSLTEQVQGASGEQHLNTVTANGTSDDGVPVTASASARVVIIEIVAGIPVMGRIALMVLAVSLLVLGYRRLQR